MKKFLINRILISIFLDNKSFFEFLILIIFFSSTTFAQDRHFWDQAVGGRSALLGGLVIGGVRDYSAAIYNPGALGFLTNNNLNFSFSAYGLKKFKFQNGSGLQPDPSYTRMSLFPSSLAGGIPFLSDSLNKFGYFLFGNSYSYIRTSARFEGLLDVIDTRQNSNNTNDNLFSGKEFLINQGIYHSLLQEVTFGFGWGRKINESISIGASLFGAYRDQTKLRNESYTALDTLNDKIASSNVYLDIDFFAIRLFGKMGIAAEFEKLKLGVTVTLPSIHIFSGATNGAKFTFTNQPNFVDNSTGKVYEFDLLGSDRQENLKANYRSTFSIGLGAEYEILSNTSLSFSSEWFSSLKPYVVIQPAKDNFFRNFPPEISEFNSEIFLRVYDSFKSVINFGFGLEHSFNEKLKGYLAFRTDYSNSAFEDIDGFFLGFTDIDIYHITVGSSIILDNTLLGVGLEYSFGNNPHFQKIFNFPSGNTSFNDFNYSQTFNTSNAVYNNINVFFGVTQLFN